MVKRIVLFVLTNILVLATISILLTVLGVKPYIEESGINYTSLAIFCLIWGFAGALVSLSISRWSAKKMLGVEVIDPRRNAEMAWLYEMVAGLSQRAGLPAIPEVGVYPSAEVNAFATGPSQKRSLVAFSAGLINSMSRDQLEGVAAHEIAHIKNGDMITMTLLQGVVNAFVMFLARVIAFAIGDRVKEESRYAVQWMVTLVLDIVLSLLGSLVVMWFSRQREFRADRGGAQYSSREKMVSALQSLARKVELVEPTPAIQTLKISGGKQFWRLFASHPPLEERIRRLTQEAI